MLPKSRWHTSAPAVELGSMRGKTCLITGGTSGIGKAAAGELARLGATVVIVARSQERGERAAADIGTSSGSGAVEALVADLSSLVAVRQLAGEFRARHGRLDVLINNAGVYRTARSETQDGLEMTFAVNHLAPFLLTLLLLDLLKASAPARVVNVASAAHMNAEVDWEDLQTTHSYGFGQRAYGQSKLANLLFTYELARRLEGTRVTANCLHPGVVRTGLWNGSPGFSGRIADLLTALARPFLRTPEQGAATIVYLASSLTVEGLNGKYFVDCVETRSSPQSTEIASAQRLWQISEMLTESAS